MLYEGRRTRAVARGAGRGVIDEGRSRGGGGHGERTRAHGDEERGPAAERQPHAEQRAAAPPNSLAALGSDYSEDAAPEPDEHAAAPTDDAGAKRQRLSGEVSPAAS